MQPATMIMELPLPVETRTSFSTIMTTQNNKKADETHRPF